MLRLSVGLLTLGLLACVGASAADSQVVPLRNTAVGEMHRRIEDVRGDRTQPGLPFVIRIHAEAGYIIMPHTHPVDENIVVVQGTWAVAMGEHYRPEALETMQVGDFAFAAKGMAHFALSKTDTIIQVHGVGPFYARWIVPVYELTGHGVLLKKTSDDPGSPLAAPPTGCFELALGARVRAKDGEGSVIGAQCSPGELTQYRVETKDGRRFWAQRVDLKTF